MTTPTCGVFVEILFVISLSKTEDPCGDEEESTIVKKLAASLGVNSFVFVQGEHDVGLSEKMRDFYAGGLFSAVTSVRELETILSNNTRKKMFFERSTILVTKEELNFTKALEEKPLLQLTGLHTVTWAVFNHSLSYDQTSYVPFNANFFVFRCNSTAITITKPYHIESGLRVTVKTLRKWPAEGFLQLPITVDFRNSTINLLFLFDKEQCNNVTDMLEKMECFQQEIVEVVAERFNIEINRIKCPVRDYPYNYPNGSQSEMFLTLKRRDADISSGSYVVTTGRLRNYDFVWPVYTTRSMMYIKYESIKSKWRAYLKPVENRVWTATVSWITLTGILLRIIKESRRRDFKFSFSLIIAFIKSVFVSLQLFCIQGVHNIPQWNSTRIVFLLSLVLCVALYEAYCAVLISSLTVTTPNIPFTSLKEFLSDGTYKLLTLKFGFHNFFIKKELKDYGYKPGDVLVDELTLPDTTQDGADLLCAKEKITYVEFRENIVRNQIRCKLLELPKSIFHQSIGIGLQKNSPYKEVLRQQLNALRSAGIIHRMRRQLLSYVKLQERETLDNSYIQVSFGHVISIFFVFGSGILISAMIFLLEICCGFKNKRNTPCEKRGRRRTLKTKFINKKKLDCDDLQNHLRTWHRQQQPNYTFRTGAPPSSSFFNREQQNTK